MNTDDMDFELRVLSDSRHDFQARYIAVANLKKLAMNTPKSVSGECFQSVANILDKELCNGERQSFFLYREAAQFFLAIFTRGLTRSEQALTTLNRLLRNAGGPVQLAVAETLGSLAVSLPRPNITFEDQTTIPLVSFASLVEQAGMTSGDAVLFYGRSAAIPIRDAEGLLVLKFARKRSDCPNLAREAAWMERLNNGDYDFSVRFDIPQPLSMDGKRVFQLDNIPLACIPPVLRDRQQHFVMAYRAHGDYFHYPNEPEKEGLSEELPEIMGRNGFLLGRFMGSGLVHTAPIPLFHNRQQQGRRDDHGLYDWPLAGRLDRWLESSAYPNIGITGMRDFEHIETLQDGGQSLYWHIGTHMVSMLLVIGSCFRNRDKRMVGWNEQGRPVDARCLFDPSLLKEMVQKTVAGYYHGLVGTGYEDDLPFDLERLADRMIEEMGIDTHMEEVLRKYDQQQMSDDQFAAFLYDHGFSERDVRATQRGKQDIVVHTGPHLGGFNQGISLVELIEAAAAASATCIVGRYCREQCSGEGAKSVKMNSKKVRNCC
jgi:hypothetical protein